MEESRISKYDIDKPKETVWKYGTYNCCGDKNVFIQSFERKYGRNLEYSFIDWLCIDCSTLLKKWRR